MTINRITLLPQATVPLKIETNTVADTGAYSALSVDGSETIDVTSITTLAQGDRWRTEAMRSYDRPLLIWFTRGQGRITIAGRTGGYGAHSAVYLPAGTMHGFTVTPAVLGYVLRFSREHLDLLPERAAHIRVREAQSQRTLTGLIDDVMQEAQRADAHRDRALQSHEGLIAVCVARFADTLVDRTPQSVNGNAAHRLTEAYTTLVERDYHRPVGVQHFARALGVTPTHLSRACREASGRPALEILKERRHFEACRLLRDTDIPISDIAQQTGFASAAYFTRAFRTSSGKSPSEFRSGR